jgi:hypothetical protein
MNPNSAQESFFDAAAVFLKVWTRIKQARLKEGNPLLGLAPDRLLTEPGITRESLKLLLDWGYLECVVPETVPGGRKQSPLTSPLARDGAMLTLTAAGTARAEQLWDALEGCVPLYDENGQAVPIPQWDKQARELWYCGVLLKRLRQPAPVLECILSAFQDQHWPARIEDPLPREGLVDGESRLHNAITHLNQRVRKSLIAFLRDGSGHGIAWRLAAAHSRYSVVEFHV